MRMEKKNNGRFNIQFTDSDPEHLQAIEILNSLPPRSKAPYIAKALIHFENCDETPTIRRNPALDRKALEAIVREILSKESRAPAPIPQKNEEVEQPPRVVSPDDESLSDAFEAFGAENIDAVLEAIDLF